VTARLVSVLTALVLALVGGGVSHAGVRTGPQVEHFVIGRSVEHRAITGEHRAWPGATKRVLVIGDIHGDEQAGERVVRRLARGALPPEVDLWLLRTANPDGVAADTRTNARRVDLNRNFPYRWAPVGRGTSTWSGPRPLSEPESRALRAFVLRLQPTLIVIFHQPLFGVGANEKGMPLVRAIAAGIRLPVRTFHCTGICPGSFTSWVNAQTPSTGVIVEFGRTVSKARVARAAATIREVGRTL
jgi:murein peptide amidase A